MSTSCWRAKYILAIFGLLTILLCLRGNKISTIEPLKAYFTDECLPWTIKFLQHRVWREQLHCSMSASKNKCCDKNFEKQKSCSERKLFDSIEGFHFLKGIRNSQFFPLMLRVERKRDSGHLLSIYVQARAFMVI